MSDEQHILLCELLIAVIVIAMEHLIHPGEGWGGGSRNECSGCRGGHTGQLPQPNRDVGDVVLGLAGLEVNLLNLCTPGGHCCNIGQGMSEQSWEYVQCGAVF